MKQKLILVMALLVGIQVFAETCLVVYPLSMQEQATALSTIGYVKLQNDSMFIYSKTDILLGQNRLLEVRKVTYEDRECPTDVEAPNSSSLCVYPIPTHDALVVKNANCDVVRVFGLDGQILITAPLYEGSGTINVSNLPIGNYLLQLNTEIVKFIKK